jgi:hypothetical protein
VFVTTIAPPVSEKHAIVFPGFIKQRGTKGEEGTSCGVNYISSCGERTRFLSGIPVDVV